MRVTTLAITGALMDCIALPTMAATKPGHGHRHTAHAKRSR